MYNSLWVVPIHAKVEQFPLTEITLYKYKTLYPADFFNAIYLCRSVIEVRNGFTFLDLIVIQIEVTPMVLINSMFSFSMLCQN